MKGRGVKNRKVVPVRAARSRQQLEPAPTSVALDPARDNLVYIVSRLTQDIEQFESIVGNTRQLLEQNASQADAFADNEIQYQSTRLSVGAAEVVTGARAALDELQRLARTTEPAQLETFERHYGRAPTEDQPNA